MRQTQNGNKGLSIIEILVVITVMGIAFSSILGLIIFSLKNTVQIKQTTIANNLAQEAQEAIRIFRDGTAWGTDGLGTLPLEQSYKIKITGATSSQWSLELGEETIDIFTRKIFFSKVFRDGQDNIASSGTEDTNTRKVTVEILWVNKKVTLVNYLTNWHQ